MRSCFSFVAAALAIGAAAVALAAWALLAPLPAQKDVAERLAAFPIRAVRLDGSVTIRWNERQVPFIEAETDDDAAFALGLVHAHLRLGQMAALRMLARGRLSEMIGPFGVDIDRGLRILGHGRTAAKIERSMDPAAQRWVRRFVDGVNHYRTARSSCHTSSAFSACGANPARSRTCWPWGVSPGPTSTGWSGTNCSPCARGPAGVNSGRV